MVCVSGNCVLGNCVIPEDCGPPPECKLWACIDNQCVEQNSSEGSCEDENPCTLNDYCLGGDCQPGLDSPDCSAQDDACNSGICVVINPDTYSCAKDPKAAGIPCSVDGLDCTIEECDGGSGGLPGECLMTSIESSYCYIGGVCYQLDDLSPSGCGTCVPGTSQTGWQAVSPGTECGSDPCDQLCSGTSCVNRWRTSMCFYPLSCIQDRLTGKTYYYHGHCDPDNPGCGCAKTYSQAQAACAAIGAHLPTLDEYQEMYTTGCTTLDCSTDPITIGADPVFNNRIKGATLYWTDSYPAVVFFLSSGVLLIAESSPNNLNAFLCVD
jgi:hypothetical protein